MVVDNNHLTDFVTNESHIKGYLRVPFLYSIAICILVCSLIWDRIKTCDNKTPLLYDRILSSAELTAVIAAVTG